MRIAPTPRVISAGLCVPPLSCAASAARSFATTIKHPPRPSPSPSPPLLPIPVSSVAALIGKHSYTPRAEALYELCKTVPSTAHRVRAAEAELGRRSRHYVRSLLLQHDRDLAARLATYAEQLERAASREEAADMTLAFTDQASALLLARGHVDAATAPQVAHSAARLVAQQRGVRREARSVEAYVESRPHRPVITQRNTENLRFAFPSFLLRGRMDGYDAATRTIVEIKTRATDLRAGGPPEHDVIQVRCYMELKTLMLRAADPSAAAIERAEISEHVPGDTAAMMTTSSSAAAPRVTLVLRDEAAWRDILDGLAGAVADVERVRRNDDPAFVRELVRASTLPVPSGGLEWRGGELGGPRPRKGGGAGGGGVLPAAAVASDDGLAAAALSPTSPLHIGDLGLPPLVDK
jgi:hypothetical protein